jgi:hypothetical protein
MRVKLVKLRVCRRLSTRLLLVVVQRLRQHRYRRHCPLSPFVDLSVCLLFVKRFKNVVLRSQRHSRLQNQRKQTNKQQQHLRTTVFLITSNSIELLRRRLSPAPNVNCTICAVNAKTTIKRRHTSVNGEFY